MRYRFQAVGDAWLYDAHGQRFASLGGGATATTGFAPLFLSLLFGVPVARWSSLLDEVVRAGSGPEFDRLVDELKPVRSLSAAAEMALLAYPAMERFVARLDGPRSPFGLRPEFLHQPNVELGPLEGHEAHVVGARGQAGCTQRLGVEPDGAHAQEGGARGGGGEEHRGDGTAPVVPRERESAERVW